MTCNEEFSNRYFARHTCKKKPIEQTSAASDQDVQTTNLSETPSTSRATVDCFMETEETEACAASDLERNELSSDTESDCEGTVIYDELLEMIIQSSEEESTSDIETEDQETLLKQYLNYSLGGSQFFFVSDLALSFIILLLKSVFYLCSFSSTFLDKLSRKFPSTVYQANIALHLKLDNFKKYVVCPKCFTLYKTYCYKSLKESVHRLVKKKGFEELCNNWRNLSSSEYILSDVYNGNIWKDFNGRKYDFFTEQRNFGLMLNVDWFQPFKYSNYSVGAVYLSILNLPREERFKRNNIILVGIIPDCKTEPPTNTFLKPLVDELQEA